MRALTIRQPHAWAIIYAGKSPENRSRNIAGSYRGPIAIHAGLGPFAQGSVAARHHKVAHGTEVPTELVFGAFIGTADLVDVHPGICDGDPYVGCCETPWAEYPYLDRGDGKGIRPAGHHLVLANAKPLPKPIPAKGRLGLWTPDQDLLDQLQEALR